MDSSREWKIKIQNHVAGHGMTMPSYELSFEGWDLTNPPEAVVDKKSFDVLVESLKYILELESCSYCEQCPPCGSGIYYARDAAEKALKATGQIS